MNKYWPVVFWMYDVSGDKILKYKPSAAHVFLTGFHTRQDAIRAGMRAIKDIQINISSMPSFIVKVFKQNKRPNISATSTLRLFVERILVNP